MTREGSEVWQMNHCQGKPVVISDETADMAAFALRMAEETRGAFNPALYPVIKAWGFTTREYRIPGEDGEIYWHILDPADGRPAKGGSDGG